ASPYLVDDVIGHPRRPKPVHDQADDADAPASGMPLRFDRNEGISRKQRRPNLDPAARAAPVAADENQVRTSPGSIVHATLVQRTSGLRIELCFRLQRAVSTCDAQNRLVANRSRLFQPMTRCPLRTVTIARASDAEDAVQDPNPRPIPFQRMK